MAASTDLERLSILQIAQCWAIGSLLDANNLALDLLVFARKGAFDHQLAPGAPKPPSYDLRLGRVVGCFTRDGTPLNAAAIGNVADALGQENALEHVRVNLNAVLHWCEQPDAIEWIKEQGLPSPGFIEPAVEVAPRVAGRCSPQRLLNRYPEHVAERKNAGGPQNRDDDWTAAETKQEKLIADLEESVRQIGRAGRSLEQVEQDWAEHCEINHRAIRAGLKDHDVVKAWIQGRRSLGEWDELRQFRAGLEKGVRRPWSAPDCWIAYHASDMAEQGLNPEQIRRRLARRLINPGEILRSEPAKSFGLAPADLKTLRSKLKGSRQNFSKLLKRRGICMR